MTGPLARIVLRYGAGVLLGMEVGEQLSMDTDLVAVVGVAIAAVTEYAYRLARKRGWAT